MEEVLVFALSARHTLAIHYNQEYVCCYRPTYRVLLHATSMLFSVPHFVICRSIVTLRGF
jgi:hypothetical protein